MSMYRKGIAGKAERMFSQLIRSRGACEACGATERLECAHIIGRGRLATACDERNAWALCHACHFRFTNRLEEHMAFVDRTIGMDLYWELYRKAQAGPPLRGNAFWQSECDRLTQLLETEQV